MKQVDPQWLSDQIMIIDFGISFLEEYSSTQIGTPKSYCAPEFNFNEGRSMKSDVWALGCISLFPYPPPVPYSSPYLSPLESPSKNKSYIQVSHIQNTRTQQHNNTITLVQYNTSAIPIQYTSHILETKLPQSRPRGSYPIFGTVSSTYLWSVYFRKNPGRYERIM